MHWEQKNTGVEISGEYQSVSPDTLAIFLKKKQKAKKTRNRLITKGKNEK